MKLYLIKKSLVTFNPTPFYTTAYPNAFEKFTTAEVTANPLQEPLLYGCFRDLTEYFNAKRPRFIIGLSIPRRNEDQTVDSNIEGYVRFHRPYTTRSLEVTLQTPPGPGRQRLELVPVQQVPMGFAFTLSRPSCSAHSNQHPYAYVSTQPRNAGLQGSVEQIVTPGGNFQGIRGSDAVERRARLRSWGNVTLRLEDIDGNDLFRFLGGVEYSEARVHVKVHGFERTNRGELADIGVTPIDFRADDMQVKNIDGGVSKCMKLLQLPQTYIDNCFESAVYTATVTVYVTFPDSMIAKAGMSELQMTGRKIMTDGLFTDMIIFSSNGSQIKCHRSVLAAHSPVLEAMFLSGMAECETNTIDMTDLSEDAIKAFIRYLYCHDIPQTLELEIAYELYYAAHKYIINNLEKEATKLIMQTGDEECSVDFAIRLFLLVRNIESAQVLKTKAIKILKSKVSELEDSPMYKELFAEHSEVARELCTIAFQRS